MTTLRRIFLFTLLLSSTQGQETAFRTRDFEARSLSTPQGITLRFADDFSPPPGLSTSSAASSWIRAYLARETLPPSPPETPSTPAEALSLEIRFPEPAPQPDSFQSRFSPEDGREISKFRRDGAEITQTLLAHHPSNLFLIHFRADKPGALAFIASTSHGEPRVHDRRFLTASSPLGELHVAILPMESEVEPAAGSITVRGEGEALLLAFFLPSRPTPPSPAATRKIWTDLGLLDGEFPDVFSLWTRLEKEALEHYRDRFGKCRWISRPETDLSRRFALEQSLHLAEGRSGPSPFATALADALQLPKPIALPEPADVTATGLLPPPAPATFAWEKGQPAPAHSN